MHALGLGRAELLRRHTSGDWGDVSPSDARATTARYALVASNSCRSMEPATTVSWVITEWDRSATTVLCPEDA